MGTINRYLLRYEKKKRRFQAIHRGFKDLTQVKLRLDKIRANDILVFSTVRNEMARLPFFLDYYRAKGVKHFFIVDNDSTDGSRQFLRQQKDVSLWTTQASYKRANYGVHWLNFLKNRYAHGHWCLVVDADEYLVYPFDDARELPALTDWLDCCNLRSFGTLLLDLYPKHKLTKRNVTAISDPIKQAPYFDSGNYAFRQNLKYQNIWIQGGVRQRVFFANRPSYAPALNKIPLVKWERGNTYVSSTHTVLPRSLNQVYDDKGGQMACGVLLHTKLGGDFIERANEENERGEHYAGNREYEQYEGDLGATEIFTPNSKKYQDWRQLEALGLMSRGVWA